MEPSEAYYSRLPSAGLIVRRDGAWVGCNRQAAALLLGSEDRCPEGVALLDWVAEEDRGSLLACLSAASTGGKPAACRVNLHPNGEAAVPCRLVIFALDDEGELFGVEVRVPEEPAEERQEDAPRSAGDGGRSEEPEWAADLPGAWLRGEMVLHYQPQWNIETGELIGMEALIRWSHPRLGMIPPLDFIPYAEEKDWIMEIGEWVLREAAFQNKRWQEAGFPAVPVSVNCSVKQFGRTNIVGTVYQILQESGLDPRYLKLEITESIAYRQEQDVVRKLHDFQNFHILISIDDFGTGYSSLSYLHEMPVQVIKLDRSFITGVESNPAKSGVVRCILDLALHLNLKVMAEGLETEEQLDFLKSQGCVEAQGYYMNRPMTVRDIESHWRGESLSAWHKRPPA